LEQQIAPLVQHVPRGVYIHSFSPTTRKDNRNNR